MRQGKLKDLPGNVQEVRDALERWRRTREKRSAIPEDLWQSAVRLAAEYGVSQTANTLRLNYGDLKKRVGRMANADVRGPMSPAQFLEVDWQPGMDRTGWVVEMEHRSGAKLKITLSGACRAQDVVSLSEAFWRQGS